MKKIIIILVVILAVAIGFFVIRFSPKLGLENKNGRTDGANIKPSDITVGVYDASENPSEKTLLLQSRLQDVGFKTIIVKQLISEEWSQGNQTTIVYRPDKLQAMDLIEKDILLPRLFRKGENDSLEQDVVIALWNKEDINWGKPKASENQDAIKEDKDKISINIIFSKDKTADAQTAQDILRAGGYENLKLIFVDNATTTSTIIFYANGYKDMAKELRNYLAEKGHIDATYRARDPQETPLVIEFAAAISADISNNNISPEDAQAPQYVVSIQIMNGSGIAGLAGKAAQDLKDSGYTSLSMGNADNFDYQGLHVYYNKDEFRNEAQNVGNILTKKYGELRLSQSDAYKNDVTVILGK